MASLSANAYSQRAVLCEGSARMLSHSRATGTSSPGPSLSEPQNPRAQAALRFRLLMFVCIR